MEGEIFWKLLKECSVNFRVGESVLRDQNAMVGNTPRNGEVRAHGVPASEEYLVRVLLAKMEWH